MKFKFKLIAIFISLSISMSISHSNETFSNKISNFYGIDSFPLLPGEYNFVFADEIAADGSFKSVENFDNSGPNISIQGEIRTGNIDTYSSDQDAISLSFAILRNGSSENEFRKTFLACNVVRDVTELISTNIKVNEDNSFVEKCGFISPEFNFVSYNYNYCDNDCVELQYTFFLSNIKDSSKDVIDELGMLIFNNLDQALNGEDYDFNFVGSYLN
ncbi:hypothetical protein OA527_02390 [Pelagibacteraceae bacterium]|nr:hypothetical protein [Pelagibacteraceae bacterium]